MTTLFPEVRIGQGIRHEALSAFPLFTDTDSSLDYLLSDEALGNESITVTEVSEAGSVPDLLVENKGDTRVLFLDGEELVGAKQNRMLNTTILIAAKSKTRIPVSCVEQGRWRYSSPGFQSGGSHSPSNLRYMLRDSVARSLASDRGHQSDQHGVWREVARQQMALHACSPSAAMHDTFETHRKRIEEFRDKLKYVQGATGVAVAVGSKVVAIDLFDKPSTCQKVWDRLLSGMVLDALEADPTGTHADVADVHRLLETVGKTPWEQVDPVGEGEEHRAKSDGGDHGSALTFKGVLVHGSVVTGEYSTHWPSAAGPVQRQWKTDEEREESERAARQLFERIERGGWDCTHCGRHGVAHEDFRLSLGPESYVICRTCGWVQEPSRDL